MLGQGIDYFAQGINYFTQLHLLIFKCERLIVTWLSKATVPLGI